MDTLERNDQTQSHRQGGNYWKFAAMIATSMVVMYAVMYLHTFEASHVQWSETRFFMTLLMGATMTIVMLGYMWGMYEDKRRNVGIVLSSIAVFALGLFLVRSQTTVQDASYMSGMIPHHSIAILTSERSELADIRVCELAVGITEAQRKEIAEMEWLISDIEANGVAATAEEAAARPVPSFGGEATRSCGADG